MNQPTVNAEAAVIRVHQAPRPGGVLVMDVSLRLRDPVTLAPEQDFLIVEVQVASPGLDPLPAARPLGQILVRADGLVIPAAFALPVSADAAGTALRGTAIFYHNSRVSGALPFEIPMGA